MTVIRGKLDPKELNAPGVGFSGAAAAYKFSGGKLFKKTGQEVKNPQTVRQFLDNANTQHTPDEKTEPTR